LAAAARVLNTFSSASKLKLGENVVDLKQSLLKKTQKKLSDGSAKPNQGINKKRKPRWFSNKNFD
jgi:hypothetical protein